VFDIPKALIERVHVTLANLDATLAEYRELAAAVRAELVEIKKLRQAIQGWKE
jgi:uncharacterized protein YfcZ (UPF0381/DUF406 family)